MFPLIKQHRQIDFATFKNDRIAVRNYREIVVRNCHNPFTFSYSYELCIIQLVHVDGTTSFSDDAISCICSAMIKREMEMS
jgi:hypothetical protein